MSSINRKVFFYVYLHNRNMKDNFPGHVLLGEESVSTIKVTKELMDYYCEQEWTWVVDPIDGTTNFVQGLPFSCVSIALAHKGEVVASVIYDPYRDDAYHAIKGQGAFRNDVPIHVRKEGSIKESFIAFGINYAKPAMIPLLRGSNALALRCRSTRMCGSAALNIAFVAAGIFNAWFEIDLSPWDVSAGTLLVTEAGGVVTDLHGEPYNLRVYYYILLESFTFSQQWCLSSRNIKHSKRSKCN